MTKLASSKGSNVLCVIPARGGSKGIPRKNLCSLYGKPLLHYALTSALNTELCSRVVVSSEDTEILELAEEYLPGCGLHRPDILASDEASSLSVLQHVLAVCEKTDKTEYEIVILVQVTNPLVKPEDIDRTILKLEQNDCDSCFTVVRLDHVYPEKLKKLNRDELVPAFGEELETLRRQSVPDLYMRNGSCYAARRDTLLNGSLFGKKSLAVIIPKYRSIDINDTDDLVLAEAMLRYLENTKIKNIHLLRGAEKQSEI